MLSIGPVESVRVARFVDPKWSSGPMRGLKKCVAYVRFADAEDAKRCVMTMNGRALRVSRGYVMVEGEDMVRRTEAAEEAVDLCFPVAGMPAHLAAVQLFWAVRDGNVGGAARSLDAGVEASVRISPMDFPEGSQSAQDGGRQWPKLSYDGALGDTALHLASRYKDLKMVRMLLERGADPTQINEEGLVAAECVAEMGGRRKGAQMGRRSFRRGSVLDSDDEDDEDGEDHARLMDRGADEDELYDLLEAEREADGQSAAGEGDDGDKASLVSERLIVVPTVGAVIGDDGQVTLTGVPTVSLRQAPAAPPPAVWAGGAWKRLDRSFRGHERKGARFHGAGAGGRKTTGYSIPGPGYYWPQVRDAWNRARDATSAADGYGGRHPRGYSWGAVKTGTGSFSYQAVRHGKGTATRQATLGDGKGMELGFHPQLSRFGASHFAPVFAHEKGPEEEAKRRTPAAGAFSRKPGTGHCNIVDMDIPGPQAYTPAPEAPAPATVFATADRRFQSVFGDIPCQEGFFLGKTLEEANLPGPAEYTLPPERGVREGMQGATFGRDEYAGRYYPTELVTGIGPGPAGYNPTFVSDKSDTGWSFGTSSQRQELWTTGTGGPNYPGPGDYKLPPCYVTMEDAPAYSFQRAEYPERQHLVAIGRGEGTVGPGSYNVATCHCEGGPAWTIGWERRLAGEVAKEEMFVPVPEEGDV
uniref:RRM domain-containing protein n=1 Tax=Hemiselmis tepida TaxID=464990 RepID=A0A7S0VEL5_9CRYP|mmetsp:Transcript_13650/g.34953  ORF Transcript_13650/g.34953 Transcript_13650/m.34953 type:complete len:698 (+) Transcript_13650:183-2276(+)